LSKASLEYEFDVEVYGDTIIYYCNIVVNGENTGSYIRMIFDGPKSCGECQGFINDSKFLECLPTLSIEESLKYAFYIEENAENGTDGNDYIIQNIKIIYIKGFPYYCFYAFGTESRSVKTGYAPAVDIHASIYDRVMIEKIQSFDLNN